MLLKNIIMYFSCSNQSISFRLRVLLHTKKKKSEKKERKQVYKRHLLTLHYINKFTVKNLLQVHFICGVTKLTLTSLLSKSILNSRTALPKLIPKEILNFHRQKIDKVKLSASSE